MKTPISFLIVFTIITFLSCSKEQNSYVSENTDKNLFISNNINTMLQAKTIGEIKQEQQLLSPEEREKLWITKLTYILEHDTLTDDQKNIVTQIRSFLDSVGMNSLIKNDSIGSQYLENNLKYYSAHFTNKQLYILIEIPYYCENFSIFNSDKYIEELELGKYAPGTKNCSCRYDLSCWNGPGDYCNSAQITCSEIKECGFFGTSTCKGRCNQDVTNVIQLTT